jgi:uncharacterized UPF0160 family protein
VEGIDGIDNGVDQYPKDLTPKYMVKTDLSSRVGHLQPWWNDPTTNDPKERDKKIDEQFKKAMQLAGTEFLECVDYFGKCWLPGRSIVEEAVAKRFEVDPSGEILLFEQFCPWKEHLSDIEKEQNLTPLIVYVLFGDASSWYV